MSELSRAGPGGGETGSSGAPVDLIAATMQEVAAIASPRIAPDHEAPKEDPPQELPKADLPQADLPQAELPKAEPPKADLPKPEPRKVDDLVMADRLNVDMPKAQMPRAEPFKVETFKADTAARKPDTVARPKDSGEAEVLRMAREHLIMSPRERGLDSRTEEPKRTVAARGAGKGRFAAMAAMLAVGVVAGAAGGGLATMGLRHFTKTTAATAAPSPSSVRDASIARIDAEITALKAGLEQTSKTSLSQFSKTSERLDRIEKAQVEPAAKLAKLSEAVDKLRAVPAQAPAAAKETADSGTPPAGTQPTPQATPGAPKTETGRLPTVEGWVLREVGHGAALIESRQGLYEVYAGDSVPGLGHVDVIRRQDGRWVVVTSKGLIVQR